MEKQKLLFHQARLANRGVAEMVLLQISACKGAQSDMVMSTLGLGISILRGGNIDVQMVIILGMSLKVSSLDKIHVIIIIPCFILLANVESPKRKEGRRLLHLNRWTDEFMYRIRFRCV